MTYKDPHLGPTDPMVDFIFFYKKKKRYTKDLHVTYLICELKKKMSIFKKFTRFNQKS
jgi:hypothetical protein